MNVKVYSTPACPYCRMAKQYLSGKGISYEEFDVSVNQNAAEEMIDMSGQMGVPVIAVDGEYAVGFDQPRIDSLLEKHKSD